MDILVLLLGIYPGVVLGLGKDSYSFVLPSPGAINKCVAGNAKSLTKLRHTVLVSYSMYEFITHNFMDFLLTSY